MAGAERELVGAERCSEAHGQIDLDRIVIEHFDHAARLHGERGFEQRIAVEDDARAEEVAVLVLPLIGGRARERMKHLLGLLVRLEGEDRMIGAFEQEERPLLAAHEEAEEAQIVEHGLGREPERGAEIGFMDRRRCAVQAMEPLVDDEIVDRRIAPGRIDDAHQRRLLVPRQHAEGDVAVGAHRETAVDGRDEAQQRAALFFAGRAPGRLDAVTQNVRDGAQRLIEGPVRRAGACRIDPQARASFTPRPSARSAALAMASASRPAAAYMSSGLS